MNAATLILASVALASLAGCITTDANGKPIPHEEKPKVTPLDIAVSNATLDGSRVVASGKPPIAFLFPGTGRLAIRDITTSDIPFSIDLTTAKDEPKRTLIRIEADGKITGTASGANGPVVTELGAANKSHAFVITYQPAEIANAPGTN